MVSYRRTQPGQLATAAHSSVYPRGNSRSATATPNGSPKRRLPQIPGQGLPATASNRGSSRLRGQEISYHASYDGGLNQPRASSLHPSTRSRSMGHYGGYSDTEIMVNDQRYNYQDQNRGLYAGGTQGGYNSASVPTSDPYYENTMGRGSNTLTSTGMYPAEDRRAQPPPPPPRNVNFEGDPPIKSSGGPRGAPPVGRSHHYGDSDMESVTSALSSHSAPHQRPRRPG